MNLYRRAALFLFALTLNACAAVPAVPAPTRPVFGNFALPKPPASQLAAGGETPVSTSTPLPPPTLTLAPQPSPTATETALPPTVVTLPPPQTDSPPQPLPRPNYILYVDLNFRAHTLAVGETVRYYNGTGETLSELVFSTQPNLWTGVFSLISLAQDGAPIVNYALDGQRLTVPLPTPLLPGKPTTLTLQFTLNLPPKGDGLFGYDYNQINLADWYPFLVPYENGWLLNPPASFGEHLTYDSADIELNLKTEAEVIVAAPAPAEANGEWTRYRLYGARAFALSASDEFLVAESAVGRTTIRSYYFQGYQAAAESALYSAKQAVALFEAKFAPYPYETLSIVEADIHDGQEYDGLTFVSSKFYGQYGGGAKNNLTTINVHEIAHQWWFGLVGDNQATQPWLDEALATYSEKIFYEYNYPKYGDWWQGFRVDYFGPSGYVDSSVYDHPTYRSYVNAVYLNGAYFLRDLRALMGDDAFFRFLKEYAARYARGRASTQDFFNLAREYTSKDLRFLIAQYFSQSY